MIIVKSKRAAKWFYILQLIFCLLFIGCLISAFYLFSSGENIFIILFILAFAAFGLWNMIFFFKNAPIVQISNKEIFFGKEKYNLSDIQSIDMHKVHSRHIALHPYTGIGILFKGGATKDIHSMFYENIWEMREFLQQVVIEKKPYQAPPITETSQPLIQKSATIKSENKQLKNAITIKGHPILSLGGGLFFMIQLFFIYAFTNFFHAFWTGYYTFVSIESIFLLAFIGLFLFLSFIFSSFMSYVVVTDEYLILKNHILRWQNHYIPLKNISGVNFTSYPRKPNILQIHSKYSRPQNFSMDTFWDRDWHQLEDELEKRGVYVSVNIYLRNK